MPTPLPRAPRPEDPLQASFGSAIVAAIQERTVVAGPGIAVRTTPGGTVVSLASARPTTATGGNCGVVPARVVAFEDGVYKVDIYADGLENLRTGTATLAATCVNLCTTLESGAVLLAHVGSAAVVDLVPVDAEFAEEQTA